MLQSPLKSPFLPQLLPHSPFAHTSCPFPSVHSLKKPQTALPQLGRAASGPSKEELGPGTGPWEHINARSVCLLPWLMTTQYEQLEANITTRQAAH